MHVLGCISRIQVTYCTQYLIRTNLINMLALQIENYRSLTILEGNKTNRFSVVKPNK